jgi:hypothetical protein
VLREETNALGVRAVGCSPGTDEREVMLILYKRSEGRTRLAPRGVTSTPRTSSMSLVLCRLTTYQVTSDERAITLYQLPSIQKGKSVRNFVASLVGKLVPLRHCRPVCANTSSGKSPTTERWHAIKRLSQAFFGNVATMVVLRSVRRLRILGAEQ